MELKYPLARLSVLYQIHGKNRSCEEAMIFAAYEGGLVTSGSLDDVKGTGHGSCGAMHTAKKIAEQKMKELYGNNNVTGKNLAKDIIYNVENDTRRYLSSKEKISNPRNSELDCLTDSNKTGCGSLAPVVIDLLIQQLRLH